MNKQLYQQFYYLRARLKEQSRLETGRALTICSDASLLELARVAPRTLEQLTAIAGLGPTFSEKYGAQFMQILDNFYRAATGAVKTSDEALHTLTKLQDRLVNLNRRNRMLYSAKLSPKNGFDLFGTDNLMQALIQKQGSELTLYKHKINQPQEEVNRHKRLTTLLREVTKELKETGQADLYIAYPFVKGKMLGDDFSVRAPLCLFPVSFNFKPDKITVKVDSSQEILYNTNLILLHNKLSKINKDIPDAGDWDFDRENFIPNLIEFFKENGMTIEAGESSEETPQIKKFTEYSAKDFPEFKNGEFSLEHSAILGRFSLFSVAIQKDFKKMIDAGELSANVGELLQNYEEVEMFDEPTFLDEEKERPQLNSESYLHYINSLNASQESAILGAKQSTKLVVQGPPGTGKSQTIISLIADYVANNKTVLMVSQKQAALNVIYSRLGNLSNFAVMLCDTQDKQGFYGQMRSLVASGNFNSNIDNQRTAMLNNDIDARLAKLTAIAKALFASHNGDDPVYKLYQENVDSVFKSNPQALLDTARLVDNRILALKYVEIKELADTVRNEELLNSVRQYLEFNKATPWLNFVKPNLTTIEHLKLMQEIDEFKAICETRSKKNFFARLFDSSHKKALNRLKQAWFLERCKVLNSDFLKNPNCLQAIKDYFSFNSAKNVFHSLNEKQKVLTSSSVALAKAKDLLLLEALQKVVDFSAYIKIDNFEKQNPHILSNIAQFKQITDAISSLITQKRNVTKELVLQTLAQTYRLEIGSAKRGNEIRRQLERQRLPSIQSFINKFQLELFRGVKVWFMTPESVAEVLPHVKGLFDLVVFDEASQLYVEKALPSITRGKHIVISGDHKQLRPSSLGVGRIDTDEEIIDEDADAKLFESNAALEEESLLDLARWKYPQVMLDYHYRSKYEELIAFSNYAFYNGKLQVSPNNVAPKIPPIEVKKVKDGLWLNRTNRQEADEVIKILKKILATRQNAETIGIVTFNSTQRDLILDLIDNESIADKEFAAQIFVERERKENGEDVGLFVKNIENVQGDERDIIIFSMGYAKNEKGRIVRNFGWLNQQGGENRLNVGITRAKRKIYFVCSIDPSELFVEDLEGKGPRLLKKYLEYIFAVSSGDKEAAQNVLFSLSDAPHSSGKIFDSAFEEGVYNALIQAGLCVDTQVGIGGYRIDMAVKNSETGEYILGIECDGKLYHSSNIARERDIHRQTYLESRGWKIHRIWSSNWWHNPKGEVGKIMEIVKNS